MFHSIFDATDTQDNSAWNPERDPLEYLPYYTMSNCPQIAPPSQNGPHIPQASFDTQFYETKDLLNGSFGPKASMRYCSGLGAPDLGYFSSLTR